MKHYFIDTNVLIDLLLDRSPFNALAEKLFLEAEQGRLVMYISSLSFKDVYYLSRKVHSHAKMMEILHGLEDSTTVVGVSRGQIRNALKSGFLDFEDAIQHECACSEKKIEAIITRDKKGFKKSSLPVLSPIEALAELG